MVSAGDYTEEDCFKQECKILEGLTQKTKQNKDLNQRYVILQEKLKILNKVISKEKPEKGSAKEIASENIKLMAENNNQSLELEKSREREEILRAQLEEAKEQTKKTQSEFINIKTKHELDKEYLEMKKRNEETEKKVKLGWMESEKIERIVKKYDEILKKDVEDINKLRTEFNELTKQMKVLNMQVGLYSKKLGKLKKTDLNIQKKELKLKQRELKRSRFKSSILRDDLPPRPPSLR